MENFHIEDAISGRLNSKEDEMVIVIKTIYGIDDESIKARFLSVPDFDYASLERKMYSAQQVKNDKFLGTSISKMSLGYRDRFMVSRLDFERIIAEHFYNLSHKLNLGSNEPQICLTYKERYEKETGRNEKD